MGECAAGCESLIDRVAGMERVIGSPPNDATGDAGRGLCGVVAELARAQRRHAVAVGLAAGIAVEVARGISGIAVARLVPASASASTSAPAAMGGR